MVALEDEVPDGSRCLWRNLCAGTNISPGKLKTTPGRDEGRTEWSLCWPAQDKNSYINQWATVAELERHLQTAADTPCSGQSHLGDQVELESCVGERGIVELVHTDAKGNAQERVGYTMGHRMDMWQLWHSS